MMMKTHALTKTLFADNQPQKATRDGYGEGLIEVGKKNERVVVLTGDLKESTRAQGFEEHYPERFIEVGVAEQNLAVLATGLSLEGFIPFVATYAVFCPGRNWDQIRISVCVQHANVKLSGAHAGISVGPDGRTHQALEDMALTRVLPGMTVLAPCDSEEARKIVHAAAAFDGPVYIRFARHKTPVFTTTKTPFHIGKGLQMTDGDDVTIIGCGPIVYSALETAQQLSKKGIGARVINMSSVKPIDEKLIIRAAKETGAVVTAEEHQIAGGLGSAVAEVLARHHPVPQEFIGMRDTFGETGEPAELLHAYRMDTEAISGAVLRVMKRKH